MRKSKIEKEINRLYSENIAYKNLPKAYQTGMKIFKAELVNFISSNFGVRGSLPSASQIASDFIQEMMCDEIEPKAKGNIHPITEDVLQEWFTQIGVRNGNDR